MHNVVYVFPNSVDYQTVAYLTTTDAATFPGVNTNPIPLHPHDVRILHMFVLLGSPLN